MAFVTRYFMWDTETTSNKPTEDDIISIGGVLCDYSVEEQKFHKLAEFHTYVMTNKKIDPVAQSIHHISKSDLYGQPDFPDAIDLLITFLKQYQPEKNARLILLAHNGSKFDDIILYCNFVQHHLDFDEFMKKIHCYGFIDSLKYLKALFKGCHYKEMPKDPKTGRVSFALGHCYSSFCGGAILENAHDALVDSQALFEVANAAPVCQKVCMKNLFKWVVNRKKAVNWIRQTAGVSFQNQEKYTQQAMEASLNPEMAYQNNQKKRRIEEAMEAEPMFEDDKLYEGYQVSRLLCLVCMTFVLPKEHDTCNASAPKSMQRPDVKRRRLDSTFS